MGHKNKTTKYMFWWKGYSGIAAYDFRARMYRGEVSGARNAILFQSKNESGLREAFENAVDSYLNFIGTELDDQQDND